MTKREDLHLAIGSESPVVEARGLHRLLSTGHTVEGLCALIAVPPKLERVLTAYAQANTKDACWIEAAMKFRQAVAREFERLVSSNAPVMDLPEAEEVEVFSVT